MPHSPLRLAVVVLVPAALAALVLAALSLAYRRALVRGLRERHPVVWATLGGPGQGAAPRTPGARRVARFVRAGGHFSLNDADLAAAGRLHLVTSRAAAGVLLLGVAVWLLLARASR